MLKRHWRMPKIWLSKLLQTYLITWVIAKLSLMQRRRCKISWLMVQRPQLQKSRMRKLPWHKLKTRPNKLWIRLSKMQQLTWMLLRSRVRRCLRTCKTQLITCKRFWTIQSQARLTLRTLRSNWMWWTRQLRSQQLLRLVKVMMLIWTSHQLMVRHQWSLSTTPMARQKRFCQMRLRVKMVLSTTSCQARRWRPVQHLKLCKCQLLKWHHQL